MNTQQRKDYDTDEVILAEAYLLEGKSSNWVRQQISADSMCEAERWMLAKGYHKHKCTGVWRRLVDILPEDYGYYEHAPIRSNRWY